MFVALPFALVTLLAASQALCATYTRTQNIQGADFYNSFSYQAIADPSHGRVNYVDGNTASRENLTFASGDHFLLRSDFTRKLSSNGPGRDSVRLQSNTQYTTSVIVFSLWHMPQGCGTWPAIWTIGADWPNGGEIDIVEGINDQSPNLSSLHTSSGCTMPASRSETGTVVGTNCDAVASNNAGCGVLYSESSSFGPDFNSNGGGWFAMERTSSYIKIWFWSRSSSGLPFDADSSSVDTNQWGTPSAYFPGSSCSMRSKFAAHNIIINLTFCGDWAGTHYADSGCPSSCTDYVNNNPSAFTDAYFDFEWLKIYQ